MRNHKEEMIRKLIHLSSLLIPFSYRYFLPFILTGSLASVPSRSQQRFTVLVLSLLAVISFLIEIFRFENRSFGNAFNRVCSGIIRNHEKKGITGATYLLVSSIICISFFPYEIAFVCLCFLALGDTMAAIVGKIRGKRKMMGTSKSLEGSLACFIITFVFALFFLSPVLALVGSVTATMAEFSTISLDDNLKIPLVSGLTMSIASIFI